MQIARRHDGEAVPADDVAEKFGVLLHHEGGEVELTLGHQLCLLGQLVMGETDVESSQVRVGEQLLHQVGGAGAVRADADGGPTQIRHVAKSAAGPAEQQQRLRLG